MDEPAAWGGDRLRLDKQQLQFFDTFGFLRLPGMFADDVGSIINHFEQVWADHGGGHDGRPHELDKRSCIVRFIDQNEDLCKLLDDPRIVGIATSLMGDDFNYVASDGNYYAGDTQWHSDGWRGQGYLSVKMAFYLDALTRDTGALRVIPGSHRHGDGYAEALQAQIRQSKELWGVPGSEVPDLAAESEPGDLLVFNHNTKHASFGGGGRRRMFTLNFTQRYRDEDMNELRDLIGSQSRFWIDRIFDEKMLRTAGPDRMRHLEQAWANDGHLAELSRKHRAEMAEPSRG